MAATLLTDPPGPELAAALTRFERQFSYPLGAVRRFRIDHRGDDRRFFQALGEAALAIHATGDTVHGVIGAALRGMVAPDGAQRQALYLGDLKISPAARGGRVLIRLLQQIQAWAGPRAQAAYAIVMDGTAATPADYTGRLGIPPFRAVAQLTLLWLRTASSKAPADGGAACHAIAPALGGTLLATLAVGQHRAAGADSALRSQMAPRWLCSQDARACALLEDTRRVKRLVDLAGREMRSAHLSCCAAADAGSATRLIGHALHLAGSLGHELLFVAVASAAAPVYQAAFADRLLALAPATVYAAGAWAAGPWLISTADI